MADRVYHGVGGALVFWRSWTTIDRTQREVSKTVGPPSSLSMSGPFPLDLDGYSAIRLDFVQGDSDSADQFPIALKAHTAPDLRLCSFTVYAQARECARAVAEYPAAGGRGRERRIIQCGCLRLRSTSRFRSGRGMKADYGQRVDRPSGARSQVTQETGKVTIVIPTRPLQGLALWLVLAALVIPITIALTIGPSLGGRSSATPGLRYRSHGCFSDS